MKIIDEVERFNDDTCNAIERKLHGLHSRIKDTLHRVRGDPNPLLQKAEELLVKKFSTNRDSKAIFFVRDIEHTNFVTDWIKSTPKLADLVRPCSVTGYSRKGMTKEEQVKVIEGFRSGHYNLLVSTSVLEEGLDVPECNIVIRFQIMSNEVADVQAQGRARAEGSTMHTIITSNSHIHHHMLINNDKKELAIRVVKLLSTNGVDVLEIRKLQDDILYQREERVKAEQERKRTWKSEDVDLLCCKCGRIACKAADVCKFGNREAPHFVVPSKSFVSTKIKKISRKDGRSEPPAVSGFTRPHKIACNECSEEWGVWGCWTSFGIQYPVLKCRSFTFRNTKTNQRENAKQWKKVPFEILFYAEYDEQESS